VTGHSDLNFFDGSTLTLKFSATVKVFGLKFSPNGKDLLFVQLQMRKSENFDPRIFTSLFSKSIALVTGHCEFK
jgi:hypothetical protein